ncbi:proton-conducting transporter membrane subunit, partial [Acinetobacter baumannii]
GLFAARDLLVFYLFFEAALIPALLMLFFYGGEGRIRAIYTFLLFTLAGSLPMLAAILAVKALGGSPTFLLEDLLAHPVKGGAALWIF